MMLRMLFQVWQDFWGGFSAKEADRYLSRVNQAEGSSRLLHLPAIALLPVLAQDSGSLVQVSILLTRSAGMGVLD